MADKNTKVPEKVEGSLTAETNDCGNQPVHIVLITDENYAMPALVAIYSMKVNKNPVSRYCVHVVCDQVSSEMRDKYASLASGDFNIDIIQAVRKSYFDQVERQILRVTSTAFFKFELPHMLKKLERVLYIDDDVLVQQDLTALYQTDIDGCYAAAVKDITPMLNYRPPILEKLKSNNKNYFNSGMMLLNLQLMREDHITEKLIDYRLNGINFFTDQDALNMIFAEKVHYLSPFYNYTVSMDQRFLRAQIEVFYCIDTLPPLPSDRWKKATILHLTGSKKPWKMNLGYLSDLYMRYYNTSPMGDKPLVLVPEPTEQEEVLALRLQRPEMHVAFVVDESTVMPTCVAIASLKESRKITSHYHVHVVCYEVSASSMDALHAMSEPGFSVDVIVPKDEPYFSKMQTQTPQLPQTSIYKFYLPLILQELDRVLYLNHDVLVLKDPDSIFQIDMSQKKIAAGKNMAMCKAQISDPLIAQNDYFNDGVMLLNLSMLRQQDAANRMILDRLAGKNGLADQDVWYMEAGDQVNYFSLWRHYLTTLDVQFSKDEIEAFYNRSLPDKISDRWRKATIVEFAGVAKPWDVYQGEASELFLYYYDKTPMRDIPLMQVIQQRAKQTDVTIPDASDIIYPTQDLLNKYLQSDQYGLNREEERGTPIIMSLTTFPARIQAVCLTLLALLQQTVKPDRIMLWLTPEEFPLQEKELPEELLKLREHGLEIMWAENLKPHTKYFHTMRRYPDAIVITVDDDIIYPRSLVEELYTCYLHHPKAIIARRTHLITFDDSGSMQPYSEWIKDVALYPDEPLMSLFATGVGGVLYPPHLMNEDLMNRRAMVSLSLRNDDIWLKFMQVLNNIPVVQTPVMGILNPVSDTQSVGLCYNNVQGGANDVLITNLLKKYNFRFGTTDTLVSRMFKDRRIPKTKRMDRNSKEKIKDFLRRAKNGMKKRFLHRAKNVLKLILPMPVKGIMRESNRIVNLLDKQTKDVLASLNQIQKQNCDQQLKLLKQIASKTNNIHALEKEVSYLQQAISELYSHRFPMLACNICGRELVYPNYHFLPYGTPFRFTCCPYCHSLERHRLLRIYLERYTNFFKYPGLKVLHFAPEKGLYDLFIQPQYGLDYFPVDIDPTVPGIVNVVNMESIPYQDSSFDVIIANHVIEHVPDEKRGLAEIRRVLKPDGFAIMNTIVYQELDETLENPEYNTEELRLKYYGQKDHVRKYGRDYPEHLKRAGFKVECIDLLSKLDSETIERYHLAEGSALYGTIYRIDRSLDV